VRAAYEPAYPDLEKFLLSTGRWRLVETLFRDLARTPSGLALGKQIYAKAKPGYHTSIRQAVERLLYPAAAPR
jgi:leukotriene-A4 hydrolase